VSTRPGQDHHRGGSRAGGPASRSRPSLRAAYRAPAWSCPRAARP
jgi:hypothetical protein